MSTLRRGKIRWLQQLTNITLPIVWRVLARCCILLIVLCCLIVHPLVKVPQRQSLDGYWLSDGYGYLAEMKGDEIKVLEISAVLHIISKQDIDSTERVLEFQEHLYKMKEVIYSGLFINMLWFWAGYNAMKRVVAKRVTESGLAVTSTVSSTT